ncbi:MAG TPA: hypothetical protein VMH78_03300 [Thermoplasmata archaeon]|nr:hypothetical protein [Thermoplasmata archaeon]
MKELSEAEYRTTLALLASPGGSDRERIALARVPSSTFTAARRRLFAEGWVRSVHVPEPGPAGLARVEIALARPALAAREPLIRAWHADPDCVVLWVGVHAAFAVFFRSDAATSEPTVAGIDLTRIAVDRDAGSVPVYFDYAGAWARFGGAPIPDAYPVGLDFATGAASARARSVAREILDPSRPTDPPRRGWMNLLRMPRPQQRAFEEKVLHPRTLLDLATLPAYGGRRIGEVLWVRGRLRSGRIARDLLGALQRDCGVYPFLLAEDGTSVVLGGLGQVRAGAPGRVPVPSARRPVMTELIAYLDPADVLIEPVESIGRTIDHRYAVPPSARPTETRERPGAGVRGTA